MMENTIDDYFYTIDDYFRQVSEKRVAASIRCNINNFMCSNSFRSIHTTSLKSCARGNPTTGLKGGYLNF